MHSFLRTKLRALKGGNCSCAIIGPFLGLIFAGALWLAWLLIGTDFYVDWDSLYYIGRVQVNKVGDSSFSYVHNLVLTWLHYSASIIQVFTGNYDALLAARVFSAFSYAASAGLIAVLVYFASRRICIALLAGIVWFSLGGNLHLAMTVEDNTWSNLYNVIYLGHIMLLCGVIQVRLSGRQQYLVTVSCGLFLSLGINIHQQLVPAVYYFPVALLVSGKFRFGDCIKRSAMLVLAYMAGSILQNYVVYSDLAIVPSLRRLWHQEYKEFYPSLWFFTSGLSVSKWCSYVMQGLRATYMGPGSFWQQPLFACLWLSIAALVAVLVQDWKRDTVFAGASWKSILILAGAFLIHVPHSLLYEPMNIERWDSTIPGVILLCGYLTGLGLDEVSLALSGRMRTAAVSSVSGLCILSVGLSIAEMQGRVERMRFSYKADSSIAAMSTVVDRLRDSNVGDGAGCALICDPVLQKNNVQVLLSYYFPRMDIITLSERQKVVYSSDYFHHKGIYDNRHINDIKWPDNIQIYAMQEMHQRIDEDGLIIKPNRISYK